MTSQVNIRTLLLPLLALLIFPAFSQAETLGFFHITINNPIDAAIGEAQLSVEVASVDATHVSFTFRNTGPQPCSITDVYFDDGALLSIAEIIEGPGVSFSQLARPRDLPAGETVDPPFNVTGDFSVDSDPPVEHEGVNPGEYLTIIFTLQTGMTISDVLTDLTTGALRIGIHVQGYTSGGGECFINNPLPPVEPECGNGIIEGDEECEEHADCQSPIPGMSYICYGCICQIVPIELSYLRATKIGDFIRITWGTDSETENAGFNILRSQAAEGPYDQINETLIPAEGGPQGADYSYTDTDVVDGITYWYLLEDVATDGQTTLHGPVTTAAAPGQYPGWAVGSTTEAGHMGKGSTPLNYGYAAALPLLFVGLWLGFSVRRRKH